VGLLAAAHLNGQFGEVVGFDDETQRHRVQLLAASVLADGTSSTPSASTETYADVKAGEVKRIKLENLELLPVIA